MKLNRFWDPNSTINQGRFRLRNPKDFKIMWTQYNPQYKGISYIAGTLKSNGKYAKQSIRFDKSLWTEAKASKWWEKHKSEYIKLWTNKDWKENWVSKKKNPVENPTDFEFKPHNWNEILISYKGKNFTRGQIKKYYEKNLNKIFPYIEGKDVVIILGVAKNKFVLKRLGKNKENIHIDKKYGINDPTSVEYWINRRVIEFHPTIGERTNLIWVDIDINKPTLANFNLAKSLIPEIKKIFKANFPVLKIESFRSGKDGIHVEAKLSGNVDTDRVRASLRKSLEDLVLELNNSKLTTKIPKGNQIRLDISTLKNTGSIRSPYSFSVMGKNKQPL